MNILDFLFDNDGPLLFLLFLCLPIIVVIAASIKSAIDYREAQRIREERRRLEEQQRRQYQETSLKIHNELGIKQWYYTKPDSFALLKSARAVDEYDYIRFFKENRSELDKAIIILSNKQKYAQAVKGVLESKKYQNEPMYAKVESDLLASLEKCQTYNVWVSYRSPKGYSSNEKTIYVSEEALQYLVNNPSVLMSKSEYNQLLKNQRKELLDAKRKGFYDQVNLIIDYANRYRQALFIANDQDELDRLVSSLFDKTINSIAKIKDIDSQEWELLWRLIQNIKRDVEHVVGRNWEIYNYYISNDFKALKEKYNLLMGSQRDFNKYIDEKAKSISKLLGKRIIRNETVIDDEYQYIRPYKKSLNAFEIEVSAQVFASAENNPLEYIVKSFYPDKSQYPQQIQKLQMLVGELETLKEARKIIDYYKQSFKQYLANVPQYVMQNDSDGFYARLGFANVSERALTMEYKISYTSNGGMARRSFTVPMNEKTIVDLINCLQGKLTMKAFTKEQRALMTSKLRQYIKERDNYTCKMCGNSTHNEPNLLLEIDHIIPVAKGGCTVEDNLQTLCWKCNRQKSSKII